MEKMEQLSTKQEYQQLRTMFNEKQWRQYLAAEAERRGSASIVAGEASVSLNTVERGLKEREAGGHYQVGERIRKPGGGRKKLAETDPTLLADLEQELEPKGGSLRVNKKSLEGRAHPDRNAQFAQINATCQEFEQRGSPIISVDCKKKELIGQFKNNGREWQARGEDTLVNVYDFLSLADGKAIPYGIYDVV